MPGGNADSTWDGEDATTADSGAIRLAHKWTEEELAAYLKSEAALDRIMDRVMASYPDIAVGSALAENPLDPPVVFIKGSAPGDLRREADQLGITVHDNQPLSIDDIDVLLGSIQGAALDAGLWDFALYPDIQREGQITLVVPASASLDWLTDLRHGEVARSLTIVRSDVPIVEPQGAFGGMYVQGGGSACTSGWTVRRILDNVRGVTSAAHCSSINEIHHAGQVHPATFVQKHAGTWGEVAWFTTGEAEADDFYADANEIRDVSAVEPRANISIGEGICVYGRASNNRNCTATVSNPDVWCGTPQKMVQMNHNITIGGDSGGGWSFNNTAYGGHFGICLLDSTFSVAALFDEALGISVALT